MACKVWILLSLKIEGNWPWNHKMHITLAIIVNSLWIFIVKYSSCTRSCYFSKLQIMQILLTKWKIYTNVEITKYTILDIHVVRDHSILAFNTNYFKLLSITNALNHDTGRTIQQSINNKSRFFMSHSSKTN